MVLKMHYFHTKKIQKFSGERAQSHSPLPRSHPHWGEGYPLPRPHPPRRLRRLDLRTFGASSTPSASRLEPYHFLITGSAVALHCCKAHAKINRKTKNSTPYKIVTPKNFTLKLCTRDYVCEVTRHANFGFIVGVCGSTISATRPVPVADDATRTRTRPAPKISTHTRPDPRVYPYP